MSSAIIEQQKPRANDSAATYDIMIWPVESITRDQINSTDAAIRKILGPDTVVEKTLNSDGDLTFWYCPLSDEQKAAVGKLDAVGPLLIATRMDCSWC